MANFSFNPTDGLQNTSIFPSNPATEAAAREQFMTLFNQLKDYVNILNNQSYPANGGNADTVDNKHASDFATSNHNHDTWYAQTNHTHLWGHITDRPNVVSRDQPRFTWWGTIPANSSVNITHNLNTIYPIVTFVSTIRNVNPTINRNGSNGIVAANYNANNNECGIEISIW